MFWKDASSMRTSDSYAIGAIMRKISGVEQVHREQERNNQFSYLWKATSLFPNRGTKLVVPYLVLILVLSPKLVIKRKIYGSEQVEQEVSYLFINSKKEESVACAYTHTRAYRKNGSKLFSCSEPFYYGRYLCLKSISKRNWWLR